MWRDARWTNPYLWMDAVRNRPRHWDLGNATPYQKDLRRAKVLGGCSAHNAMVYCTGSEADWREQVGEQEMPSMLESMNRPRRTKGLAVGRPHGSLPC